MTRILIIEDEAAAASRLKKMVGEIMPDAYFLPFIDSIKSAVKWFKSNDLPDLIFLDIQLADGLSFEIFKQVEVNAPVIFTTAYDQYALDAFKLNSIDYLLKPVKKDELKKAIEKFRKRISPAPQIQIEQLLAKLYHRQVHKQRFAVKYGDHIKTVETDEAAYFFTENKGNFLATNDGRRYIIDYNMDQLEGLLDPKKFFRINRQFIIGFHAICDMISWSKSRVLIKLNPEAKHETIVSAERSAAFKAWLDDN